MDIPMEDDVRPDYEYAYRKAKKEIDSLRAQLAEAENKVLQYAQYHQQDQQLFRVVAECLGLPWPPPDAELILKAIETRKQLETSNRQLRERLEEVLRSSQSL